MKNKFTITEEEKCRILNLHESAILKENSQNILNENEKKTYTFKSGELFFKQKDGGLNGMLKLFKGTTFEPWPKDEMGGNFVENYLITTKKVTAQFADQINKVVMFAKNKSWVVYNCKIKSFYLMNSTDKVVASSKDFASNERMVFPSAGQTPPLDELCKTSVATRTVEKKKIEDVTPPPGEQKIISGTKEDKLDKDIDCKNKNPYNALTDGGLNWKKESQKWISDKCNGTTPCILGNAKTNINLRNAFCNKTWPTDQNNLQKLDKYTFDFDEIMKAIDVTGKCPKKSDKVDSDKVESDKVESDKNVTDDEFNKYIDGAAPVDKKLSDEDYYKLIN